MTLDNHFARYIKNNTGETKPTQSQAVKTFEIPGTTGPLSTRDILNILDKGLPQDFNKKILELLKILEQHQALQLNHFLQSHR
jgi:hypothetical protein